MSRVVSRLLIAVVALLLAAPAFAKVDPGLVGSWFVMTSTPQGALFLTLDIQANGNYSIRGEGSGAPPARGGRIEASGGRFAMTGTGADSGTYSQPYPAMLQLTGRSGSVWWNRKDPDASGPQMGPSAPDVPPVAVQQVAGQSVPAKLPDYLAGIAKWVTAWQKDARLVALEVRMMDGGVPSTRLHFWSPQARQALSVMPDAAAGYQINPVEGWSYSTTPLPPKFIDLAQAAAVARRHGMSAMNAADLRIFAPDGRPPVLAWQIRDSSGPWYVDGLSGAMLVGDVSGDRAYLEAEWQRAAAGMRSFLDSLNPQKRQAQGRGGGGRQCGFSYPDASTDYQCTGQGGNWSCTPYYGGTCSCSVYTAC
ncbi:MAG: hypothetical protein AB7O49_18710 [Sphingomonadales bacterium]